MKKINVEFALSIIQRNLDKGYINSFPMDDGQYESGYASCLKDIAFLLLGDDSEYGTQD